MSLTEALGTLAERGGHESDPYVCLPTSGPSASIRFPRDDTHRVLLKSVAAYHPRVLQLLFGQLSFDLCELVVGQVDVRGGQVSWRHHDPRDDRLDKPGDIGGLAGPCHLTRGPKVPLCAGLEGAALRDEGAEEGVFAA
jgi:hypothetical protein